MQCVGNEVPRVWDDLFASKQGGERDKNIRPGNAAAAGAMLTLYGIVSIASLQRRTVSIKTFWEKFFGVRLGIRREFALEEENSNLLLTVSNIHRGSEPSLSCPPKDEEPLAYAALCHLPINQEDWARFYADVDIRIPALPPIRTIWFGSGMPICISDVYMDSGECFAQMVKSRNFYL